MLDFLNMGDNYGVFVQGGRARAVLVTDELKK
jgi:hypothetical protein